MCATSGSSSTSTGSSRQSISKVYSAAPDVRIVASAVDVRSTADGSHASRTPARSRWAAISSPWWSGAKLVASRVGRPSRARATATFAALPPAYSCRRPLGVCTMSTSDSPTTSTPRSMGLSLPRCGMIGPCPTRSSSRASVTTILGIAAAIDLLAGLVLSVIGVSQDMQALAIIGVLLLLSGGAVMAYVVWQRNKPETL